MDHAIALGIPRGRWPYNQRAGWRFAGLAPKVRKLFNDNYFSLPVAIVVIGSLKIWSHFEKTKLLLMNTLRRS